MRTFEGLLWFVSAVWVVWWLVREPSRRANFTMAAFAVALAGCHLAMEGARFHMGPTYVILAGLWVVTLRSRSASNPIPSRRWIRLALAAPIAAVVTAAAALPTIFPVFTYAKLSGPYGTGTAEYELKHGPRGRDLVIQAWYPTAAGGRGEPVGITSRPELLQAAYASFTGLPKPLFDNIRFVKTHTILNAAVAPGQPRYPVILFSHGPLSANRSQSVFQMEALASRGFVVVAIDHTGYASTTIFPDGHSAPPSPDATWPVFVDARSTDMLNTWVADVRFVIDRLTALDADDPDGLLTGRLDLSRIGYVGASFGGSVVVQALLDEPRIKAGLSQDGKPYFSDRALTDLRRPLMYMQSAAPYIKSSDAQLARWGLNAGLFKRAEQDHYARQMQLFGRVSAPIYNVYIRRTNHVTFSDLYTDRRCARLDTHGHPPGARDHQRLHVGVLRSVPERRCRPACRRSDAFPVCGRDGRVPQRRSANRIRHA